MKVSFEIKQMNKKFFPFHKTGIRQMLDPNFHHIVEEMNSFVSLCPVKNGKGPSRSCNPVLAMATPLYLGESFQFKFIRKRCFAGFGMFQISYEYLRKENVNFSPSLQWLPICRFPSQLEVCILSFSLSVYLAFSPVPVILIVFNTYLAFILCGLDCRILHIHIWSF